VITKTAPAKATKDAEDDGLQQEGVISRIPGWVWAVGLLGLAVTIAGYLYAGIRWALPGLPSWAGVIAGFMLIWLAASLAVEVLHRNRRHIARHAARGITTGYSAARARGAPLWQQAAQWAGQRWRSRSSDGDGDGEQTSTEPGAPASGDTAQNGDQDMTGYQGEDAGRLERVF
jgi:hypothetical protein